MSTRRRTGAVLAAATLSLGAGCAGAGSLVGGGGGTDLVVAIVSNPQMEDAVTLSREFEADNPGIDVQFVSLPENEARRRSPRRWPPAAGSSTSS